MTELRRVCVFCGSSAGLQPAYLEATVRLAETLAGRGIGLVYGGARIGLMGVLADAMLGSGGEVIGVIPIAGRANRSISAAAIVSLPGRT